MGHPGGRVQQGLKFLRQDEGNSRLSVSESDVLKCF